MGTMARPRGGAWLAQDLTALKQAGVDVLISALTPREIHALDLRAQRAICESLNIRLVSLPIEDREVPDSTLALLEPVATLAADLRAGLTLVSHCRAGIGRSSLLAAAILCAVGWAPTDAWACIESARGR